MMGLHTSVGTLFGARRDCLFVAQLCKLCGHRLKTCATDGSTGGRGGGGAGIRNHGSSFGG
jgi:hypothetical protein